MPAPSPNTPSRPERDLGQVAHALLIAGHGVVVAAARGGEPGEADAGEDPEQAPAAGERLQVEDEAAVVVIVHASEPKCPR